MASVSVVICVLLLSTGLLRSTSGHRERTYNDEKIEHSLHSNHRRHTVKNLNFPDLPFTGLLPPKKSNTDRVEESKRILNGHSLNTADRNKYAPGHPGYDYLDSETDKEAYEPCIFKTEWSEMICIYFSYDDARLPQDQQSELHLNSSSIPLSTKILNVQGYETVHIHRDTFSHYGTSLAAIEFKNIKSLIFETHSLKFAEKAKKNTVVTIRFINCGIQQLPSFTLTQNITNSRGKEIIERPDREMTRYLKVEFTSCQIGTIQQHALTAAHVSNFNLTYSTVESIEERAIDLTIYKLALFKGNVLPVLITGSICIYGNQVVFSNNKMSDLQNFSIVIETDTQVTFEHNKVEQLRQGALAGIEARKARWGGSIAFLKNRIANAEFGALVLHDSIATIHMKVLDNIFVIQCDCNITLIYMGLMGIEPDENGSPGTHADKIKLNGVLKSSYCFPGEENIDPVYVEMFLNSNCADFPLAIALIAGSAIGLFLLSLSICIYSAICLQRRKNKCPESQGPGFQSSATSHQYISASPVQSNNYRNMDFPPDSPVYTIPSTTAPWMTAAPQMKTYQQGITYELVELAEPFRGSISPSSTIEGHFVERASCPFN